MIKVKVTGLNEAIAKLSTLPKRVQTELKTELKLSAEAIRRNAIKDAPADQGKLRNSIVVTTNSDVSYSVVVQNNYAAYMEFGTKSKTKIPAELSAYAAQFRGKGAATGINPIDALEAWVRRKGIAGTYSVKSKRRLGSKATKQQEDRSVAFLIWRKIKKRGVTPHPFFFHNVFEEADKLSKRISQIFSNLD